MRRALRPTPPIVPVSMPVTLPAPVGGWNARDGRAVMPITDAISLDNWYPETSFVSPRKGSDTYASSLGAQVETIFSYSDGANLKLFVAAGNVFQNISTVGTSGTVTSGTIAAGTTEFQNSRFQYKSFGTGGGEFLIAVNGEDERQIYNGSIWFEGTAYYATTIAAYTNVEIHQRRLFYLEKDTLRFVYHTNTEAIGGTVAAFDLAPLFTKGGELLTLGTWTRDGGAGMDDLIAFASSLGEIAVYQGIDPGDADNWALQGVYEISSPVSNRSMAKFGAELLTATADGVVPMSAIVSGLVQQTVITNKIDPAITNAWGIYKSYFGWELKYAPTLGWLILNVPISEGNYQQQYVMNTKNGSWCRFKGLYANTWEEHDGLLYFGVDGSVIQAGTTSNADDGNDIDVDARQAPSTFGMGGRQMLFRMFKPLINADGDISLAADINVDFSDAIPTNIPAATPISVAEWDVATWDDFFWADEPVPALFWQSVGRYGSYGGVRITGQVNSLAIEWMGTNIVFEPGSVI